MDLTATMEKEIARLRTEMEQAQSRRLREQASCRWRRVLRTLCAPFYARMRATTLKHHRGVALQENTASRILRQWKQQHSSRAFLAWKEVLAASKGMVCHEGILHPPHFFPTCEAADRCASR